ncbi:unnamed protein product [Amoebophrya sp. A120]|nr:unnamed protein product [Amoebophrya sp. A120]|eukprot:GSA120T00000345001.1
MVIPLPAVAVAPTPSRCALRARYVLFVFILFLFAHAVQQFVMLDILGGFVTMLLASVGLFTLRDGSVDMQCLVTWGMVTFLQGIFAIVILIDRMVKPKSPPMFTNDASKMPDGVSVTKWNFISALSLLGIIALWGVSITSFIVYNKTVEEFENMGGVHAPIQPDNQLGSERGGVQDYGSGQLGSTPSARGQQQNTFTPFSGAGNRVGGDGDE